MPQKETNQPLQDVLEKLKRGDKSVFEGIFTSNYADLVKYSFQFTQIKTVSEEIVQEVFISIWERRENLNIQSSLKSYLYRAVKNRTINYIKLQLPKDQATSDLSSKPFMAVESDDNEQDLRFIHQLISDAISCLPLKCRTIFLLSRNEGLSHKEIAKELNISSKTVENQIGIALKRLRKDLQPLVRKIL